MTRTLASAAALMAALAIAGCSQSPADPAPAAEAAATAAAERAAPGPEAREAGLPAALPAARGAPAYAVIYPGATVGGPVTVARGPDGPGGILSFTTDASPDEVIAFYRGRAESAGLASVMAMNTGEARAYGAAAEDGSGKLLRVVATPVTDGPTNVQLDWTAGR